MLTPDELRTLIASYVDAINARDAQGIAALFAEDAVQADPADQPAALGRPAIAEFFANGIAASDSWKFSASAIHTCASTVAINFEIAVVMGDSTMAISGIEVFDVAEDGLIASVHAYWDQNDVRMA